MTDLHILTPTATRELLERLAHRPRRQLGQNFLVDGNIVRKSLDLAAVARGDIVVEIGPGLGTLTCALLGAGAEVFAIERDPVLHAHLASTIVPASGGRFHLTEGDAMDEPLAALPPATGRAFKIVANLPYAISTPWMEAVLGGPLPERMVLMLQKEAAQRFSAQPGSKSFGAISVFLQAAYDIAPGHRVSRTCFHPQPDVDSVLFRLVRRPAPYVFSDSGRRLIRVLFQQRRKQLAPLLKRHAPDAAGSWLDSIASTGIRADVRAESVPVNLWTELDRLSGGRG